MDMLGHLNQSVYHELLEEGRAGLITEVLRRAEGEVHGGYVVVHVDLDYRHEVRKDHREVEVIVSVQSVGSASVQLAHEIRLPDGRDRRLRAHRAGRLGPRRPRQAHARRGRAGGADRLSRRLTAAAGRRIALPILERCPS